MIQQLLLSVHVLVAFGLIGLILIQQGKGAEAGASFGSGASQTVFGSQGTGSFLTRATAILACVFAFTSISLSMGSRQVVTNDTLADKIEQQSAIIQMQDAVKSEPKSDDTVIPE